MLISAFEEFHKCLPYLGPWFKNCLTKADLHYFTALSLHQNACSYMTILICSASLIFKGCQMLCLCDIFISPLVRTGLCVVNAILGRRCYSTRYQLVKFFIQCNSLRIHVRVLPSSPLPVITSRIFDSGLINRVFFTRLYL